MVDDVVYRERISSKWTEALFLVLSLLFLLLLLWRLNYTGLDIFAVIFGFFLLLFSFYSGNYRTLEIKLTTESLILSFGMFKWIVSVNNIEGCSLDEIPIFMRYGGAGIHFMTIRKRYRASLNFLEYPRVVIALKNKVGPVQDISFSTCHPDELMKLIHGLAQAAKTG
jgi:hypothetical protein